MKNVDDADVSFAVHHFDVEFAVDYEHQFGAFVVNFNHFGMCFDLLLMKLVLKLVVKHAVIGHGWFEVFYLLQQLDLKLFGSVLVFDRNVSDFVNE